MLKLFHGLFVLTFLFYGTSAASTGDTPSADTLFEKAAILLGLNDQANIRRIEAHAHVTVGAREYDTIVWSVISPEGFGDASFTILEENGTREYRDQGGKLEAIRNNDEPQELPAAMGAFIHGHQFHRRVLFPSLELASYEPDAAESEFDGTASYKVAGKTADGSLLSYHFDRTTSQMLGFQLTVFEDGKPRPMDFVLKDWRRQDDVSLFWRLEISDMGDLYVYEFNKILLTP